MLHSTLIGGPGVRLRMVNSELIVLEWDTPFTWNHTTIEHYKITSSNPDWTHTMYTDTSLQLQRPASATECAEYTFTVSGSNQLADGEATTISGGFPIGKLCNSYPETNCNGHFCGCITSDYSLVST